MLNNMILNNNNYSIILLKNGTYIRGLYKIPEISFYILIKKNVDYNIIKIIQKNFLLNIILFKK